MLFKLSNLNPNLALTLGYLNPALNNSAQVVRRLVERTLIVRPLVVRPLVVRPLIVRPPVVRLLHVRPMVV